MAHAVHAGDVRELQLRRYMKEFDSAVADFKNSVKNRANAQASCAASFIAANLAEDYKGQWIHVDMASPAKVEERATGYGAALIAHYLQK